MSLKPPQEDGDDEEEVGFVNHATTPLYTSNLAEYQSPFDTRFLQIDPVTKPLVLPTPAGFPSAEKTPLDYAWKIAIVVAMLSFTVLCASLLVLVLENMPHITPSMQLVHTMMEQADQELVLMHPALESMRLMMNDVQRMNMTLEANALLTSMRLLLQDMEARQGVDIRIPLFLTNHRLPPP
jgi:hypothetical protein